VAVLARVTSDVEAERGPDLACEAGVPRQWFVERAAIEVTLPRLLGCVRCEGGGCDACGRRGAFARADCGAPERVELTLPDPPGDDAAAICLRLPDSGASAEAEEQPAGHLLLTLRLLVEPGEPDTRVRRLVTRAGASPGLPPPLIWAGATLLVILLVWWIATR
jgi:hypothetical protein